MATHLVSFIGSQTQQGAFADESLLQQRQEALHRSALRYGNVDQCHAWTLDRLRDTDYYRANKALLGRPKGCGYWAWKPYIILQTLAQIADDDVVIYCDVGRPHPQAKVDHGNLIERSLTPLVEWARQHNGFMPGVYLPHHGPAKHWIKRDCFTLMDCDNPTCHEQPTVQAGYSVWFNTPAARDFLNEWMTLNLDSRLISDDENQLGGANLDGFRRHCHDQATLTLLCYKREASVFGDSQQQFWGFRNINYIALEAALRLRRQQGCSAVNEWGQRVTSFPPSLRRWLDLLCGGELTEPLRVTTTSADLFPHLPALFESASHQYSTSDSLAKHANSDLLLITNLSAERATAATLSTAYKALASGGVLFIGPLPPVSELEQCARDVSEQGRFPDRYEFSAIDPVRHGPKVPNSRNPVFIGGKSGKFAIMVKPISVEQMHRELNIGAHPDQRRQVT